MRMRIGVVGAAKCSAETAVMARLVGRCIAEEGAALICGGLGGVMKAAARGAKEAGGVTVGILPGTSEKDANPYIDIPILTGLGHARNVLVVQSSHAVIAVKGSYGTLSEISIALKSNIPVVGLNTWNIDERVYPADDPENAVKTAFSLVYKKEERKKKTKKKS
jgi:uncharacterized protein (TIGR00725 family)